MERFRSARTRARHSQGRDATDDAYPAWDAALDAIDTHRRNQMKSPGVP